MLPTRDDPAPALTPDMLARVKRAAQAWRDGAAFSSLDQLDGDHHGRQVVVLLAELERTQRREHQARTYRDLAERDLIDARTALRVLVDSLFEDDSPRQAALRAAFDTLRSWGTPARWDVVRGAGDIDGDQHG
jgi:hypothetical protein